MMTNHFSAVSLRLTVIALAAVTVSFATEECKVPGLEDRSRMISALERVTEWAATRQDSNAFDPVVLEAEGQKGKKKLGEALELYQKLLAEPDLPNATRKLAEEHVRMLLSHVMRKEYHNLKQMDAKRFKEESMSYMRVAYLIPQLTPGCGNFTRELRRYKNEIKRIQVRGSHFRFLLSSPLGLLVSLFPRECSMRTCQVVDLGNGDSSARITSTSDSRCHPRCWRQRLSRSRRRTVVRGTRRPSC